MKWRHIRVLSMIVVAMVVLKAIWAQETVTVDNFVRAETDMTLKRYVDQGAFGKLLHLRQPTPIDKQDVIRMNRDTLYSFGIFDLDASPVTILKPDSKGRFQSMLVINQDHSMQPAEHGAGSFTLTKEKIGTRYVIVGFRTFMNANDPKDIKAANELQDKITIEQAKVGSFEIPDWDEASLGKVREAINILASTKTDASGMFGDKSKLNPINHLLGTLTAGEATLKRQLSTRMSCPRTMMETRPIRLLLHRRYRLTDSCQLPSTTQRVSSRKMTWTHTQLTMLQQKKIKMVR